MNSDSRYRMGVKMASALYFSLPQNLRKKISEFLTSEDMDKIIRAQKEKTPDGLYAKAAKELQFAGKKKGVQKKTSGNIFGYAYLLIHFTYFVVALGFSHYYQAGAAIVYGLGGFLFFMKESDTYVRLRFYPVPFHLRYLVYTFLGYPVIMLPLGYFSSGSVSLAGDNILLFQAAVLAPVFEEIFFREALFKLLKDFTQNPFWIIGVTSFLFAVVHLSLNTQFKEFLPFFVVYFTAGGILGAIRWVSCSLFYPVVLHIAVNTTIFFL